MTLGPYRVLGNEADRMNEPRNTGAMIGAFPRIEPDPPRATIAANDRAIRMQCVEIIIQHRRDIGLDEVAKAADQIARYVIDGRL